MAEVYLWPECVGSWIAWNAVQTQWRLGPSGHRVGLDHTAVCSDLRALGYGTGKRRSLRRVLGEIIAMEGTVLEVWLEQLERDRARRAAQ